jgi:hypothetical protein
MLSLPETSSLVGLNENAPAARLPHRSPVTSPVLNRSLPAPSRMNAYLGRVEIKDHPGRVASVFQARSRASAHARRTPSISLADRDQHPPDARQTRDILPPAAGNRLGIERLQADAPRRSAP